MRFPRSSALALLVCCLGLIGPAHAASYRLLTTISIPGAPIDNFDISYVDPATQTFYFSDRTNAGVNVINMQDNSFVGRIGGFVGVRGKNSVSGPNGIVLVPEQKELWVADGDSTVKVVDLQSKSVVASIPTGGKNRADEMDYDAADGVVMVTNGDEEPPFVTFISTKTRAVLGRLNIPEAKDGLEFPQWDRVSGNFFLSVPQTPDHPGGAILVIDPKTMKVLNTFPVALCTPYGLAFGPNQQLLVGCGKEKDARSIILDAKTGQVIVTLTQVGGSDQVWFNPSDSRYYLAARYNPGGAVLGIIDARSNTWVENVPSVKGAKSLAVNPKTNRVFMPLPQKGVGVFGQE